MWWAGKEEIIQVVEGIRDIIVVEKARASATRLNRYGEDLRPNGRHLSMKNWVLH